MNYKISKRPNKYRLLLKEGFYKEGPKEGSQTGCGFSSEGGTGRDVPTAGAHELAIEPRCREQSSLIVKARRQPSKHE